MLPGKNDSNYDNYNSEVTYFATTVRLILNKYYYKLLHTMALKNNINIEYCNIQGKLC